MKMRTMLLGLLAALSLTPAMAGDLSGPAAINKAMAFTVPVNPCTNTNCTGLWAGATISGVNTGVNVINLGSVNAGGQYMGVQGGYQLLNNNWMLGVKARLDYEVYAPSSDIISAGGGLRDKLFAFEGIELGGNLTQLVPGLTAVNLPGWLSTATPAVQVGACQHGKLTGYCVGAEAKFYIPNTRWSLDLDYLNAQYGQTTIAPGQTSSTENRGMAGISYHF